MPGPPYPGIFVPRQPLQPVFFARILLTLGYHRSGIVSLMANNQHLTELHLEEIEQRRTLTAAPPLARAVSFLADCFLFYATLFAANFILLYIPTRIFGYNFPSILLRPLAGGPALFNLVYTGCCVLLYVAYYTLQETWLGGQTMGKRLTGTEAVQADGGHITFSKALTRSLCRLIPLDLFFAFTPGGPLHDRLSNTVVVRL